ncbi:hypothetical protein SDC9_106523 [bioreactor metagenome]|uniref:Stage III sporulation protein AG n=1 Tax=bioreactor metagenome TaxID=1076179 RepID=A0A645B2Q6_9ZZZZ|nr:hypothetical protein [Candidatus Metalachnospira sp.]
MEIKDLFKKRKGKFFNDVIIAVAFGAMLIIAGEVFFSGDKKPDDTAIVQEEAVDESDSANSLESKTESLLSQVEGAGRVRVMITLDSDGESVYAEEKKTSNSQTDEKASEGDNREIASETEEKSVVMVNNGDGSTSPVIIKETAAKIAGIVIVAEGGDNILVKDSLIRAAQALFDVPANKVAVFKMK